MVQVASCQRAVAHSTPPIYMRCSWRPRVASRAPLIDRTAAHCKRPSLGHGHGTRRRSGKEQHGPVQALGQRGLRMRPATAAAPAAASSTSAAQPAPCILWFKHDLRLDDHPGLRAALQSGAPLLPVYCFDPAHYSSLLQMPGGIAGLQQAVQSLQQSLRQLGSDLILLSGPWEEQLPAFAAHVGAGTVIAEQEVEWEWAADVAAVRQGLPAGAKLQMWAAPLFAEFLEDFRELKRRQPAINPPLDPPAALPPVPEVLLEGWEGQQEQQKQQGQQGQLFGALPSAAELERAAGASYAASLDSGLASLAATAFAADWLGGSPSISSLDEGVAASRVIDQMGAASSAASTVSPTSGSSSSSSSAGASAWAPASAWEAELAAELAAGEGPVMAALESYLRVVESDMNATNGELGSKLSQAVAQFDIPAAPDGCFPALFTRALALGVVSKRRLYHQAQSMLQGPSTPSQPPAGLQGLASFLARLAPASWLLGGSMGGAGRTRKAAAAVAAAEARDFHEQMAATRQDRQVQGATLRHWRWRGILTDYLEAAPASEPPSPDAPAILLVHGFGAFSEQWRDNVAALAEAGFHVYAPTMPGYGRSEKPAVPYGQDVWRDFVAEFVLHVVRRPVVVAGNSIGGFIAASVCADFPGMCQGLVLLNSAGLLVKDYQPPAELPTASPPPRFVAQAVSQALFSFLEGSVEDQLKRLYPVRPERADAWLAGEISRAACDPGALGVFRSVFYLPRPRPLSYLVGEVFGGPTLVLQGSKDPLNDAVGRARQLGELCSNVEVSLLDAGHCPHDEVPEQVNSEILRFIRARVLRQQPQGQAVQLA